jgi:hypothetical protein
MVATNGNIGSANFRACVTGIGVLNGGRVGTTIPSDDRQGVWAHLARHIRDAGREPPERREKGLTFRDEAEHVLANVQAFVYRVQDLSELREAEGAMLSAGRIGRIKGIADELEQHSARLRDLLVLAETNGQAPEKSLELLDLFQKFREIDARIGPIMTATA